MDAPTGALLWTRRPGLGSVLQPTISDGAQVYAISAAGSLAAIDPAAGDSRWILGGTPTRRYNRFSTPAIDDENIYIGGGYLWAVRKRSVHPVHVSGNEIRSRRTLRPPSRAAIRFPACAGIGRTRWLRHGSVIPTALDGRRLEVRPGPAAGPLLSAEASGPASIPAEWREDEQERL